MFHLGNSDLFLNQTINRIFTTLIQFYEYYIFVWNAERDGVVYHRNICACLFWGKKNT